MGSPQYKRIIIVDDHPVMREGLAETVDAQMEYEVVGQFESGEEALDKYDSLNPDLAILDISLQGMSGLELIKHLQAQQPHLKLLIVSMHDEVLYAQRVLRAGAKGYVMKVEAGDVIMEAIRKVLSEGVYVSDEISEQLLLNLAGLEDTKESPLDLLSDRELEVFELTGKGNSTSTIAETLHLSIKTIETYRARIKKKLNLENATELMRHAVKWVESERATYSDE